MEKKEKISLAELEIAFRDSNFLKANEILKVLCKNFPNNYNYTMNLGLSFRKLGQPNKAFKAYKDAKKLNNKDYLLFYNLGNLLKDDLGKKDQAIKYYLDSLKLNSENIDCWKNLALTYTEIQKFDLVIKVCERILSLDPNHFDGNYLMGFSFLSLMSPKKAKVFVEKAIEIEYNIGALRTLSAINHMLGNKNEAVRYAAKSEGAFIFYSDERPYSTI